jgi:hypothetical protein
MSAPSDADIIASNPIGIGLDGFHRLLSAKRKELDIYEIREFVEVSATGKLNTFWPTMKTNSCSR